MSRVNNVAAPHEQASPWPKTGHPGRFTSQRSPLGLCLPSRHLWQIGADQIAALMAALGANRTGRDGGNDVNDPTETWAALGFRSAKALFVPSSNRDIFPLWHGHDPPPGGSHGNPHPTTRVHC